MVRTQLVVTITVIIQVSIKVNRVTGKNGHCNEIKVTSAVARVIGSTIGESIEVEYKVEFHSR